MEHVSSVIKALFESPILYICTLIALFIMLKKGLFSIETSAIKLGRTRDLERKIIAAQISFINLRTEALAMHFIRKFPEVNKYHTKYTLSKIGDELVRRVSLNHIVDTDIYKADVYMTILDLTRRRASLDYYWSEEFETFVKEQVDNIIKHLIEIRQHMS